MADKRSWEVADLADGTTDETLSHLRVFSEEFAIANGVVANKDKVTWKERCFIKCQLKATNTTDADLQDRNCPWEQVTPRRFPGLTDFLDQWEIIFNKQRLDGGLVPI